VGTERYNDIIHLPHHVSKSRPKMSLYDRAAQFSPFAALSGHSDAIAETARSTDIKKELDPAVKEVISSKLRILNSSEMSTSDVNICYFVEDIRKSGGEYEFFFGKISSIDEDRREIMLSDGRRINIDSIYSIEGQVFERFGY